MSVGFRIFTQRPLPDPELVRAYGAFATAPVADAMHRMCAMTPDARLLSDPVGTMSGVALTVKARPGDSLMIHKALNMAEEGDVLIALPSSGVHSNGFSLVRKVFQVEKGGLDRRYDDLSQTLGETLLTPTRIYVKPVLALLEAGVRIRSVSHITGGGFYENIPRSLAEGMEARIERSAVKVPPIFDIIAREGGIPERDMFNTFNMGVGMCLTVAAEDVDLALDSLADAGEDGAYALGEIARGEGGIELC